MSKLHLWKIGGGIVLCIALVWQLSPEAVSDVRVVDVTTHSITDVETTSASTCPFGHTGGQGQWTGKTKVVNAKIFYEQKCIQGHKWFTAKP